MEEKRISDLIHKNDSSKASEYLPLPHKHFSSRYLLLRTHSWQQVQNAMGGGLCEPEFHATWYTTTEQFRYFKYVLLFYFIVKLYSVYFIRIVGTGRQGTEFCNDLLIISS